ncbi:hypothetical protein [Polaromonas sp. A23]|nr:hypothetical protein [Polaromonas sp. A23]
MPVLSGRTIEPGRTGLASIAALLVLGALAFSFLPKPPRQA